MRLIAIHPDNAPLAWKDIEKYVIEALKYTDDKYELADIKKMVQEQSLLLWVVYNDDKERAIGCLLTEVIKHPKSQSLFIFLMGSEDVNETMKCLDELKEYAKGIGCNEIEFYGRAGWEKVLRPFAFEKVHIGMRLKL